jgi:hypothetical protein
LSLKGAFADAGIVPPQKIKRGGIYPVPDNLIIFPEDRLPGARKTPHERRYVLILQTQVDCDDITRLSVLIAPLGTKKQAKAATEYELPSGMRFPSLVKLGLVQPILKKDLEPFKAETVLNKEIMKDILTVLFANVGGIERIVR